MIAEQKYELVVFSLESTFYAIESRFVTAIRAHIKITYVPGCPAFVLGVINLNGSIESVLDLKQLLTLNPSKVTQQQKILLISIGNLQTGFLIDTIEDIITIDQQTVKPPLTSLSETVKEFIDGSYVQDKRHIIILNMKKLHQHILESS
ncbi:MAG: chemotaxis protein CheW [Sphaerochaeta sp.]|nr:chemotaxis protein CheW [Sphaerochaeta sp.]